MDLIYGRNQALEAIDAKREIEYISLVKEDSKVIRKIIEKAQNNKIKVNFVDHRFFKDVKVNHQNVLTCAKEYEYATIEDIKDKKFFVILDKIEDPHNLGAIIRSCEALGVDAVIIPERRAVKVNTTVYRTSAGAVNHIDIVMVKNITRFIQQIKKWNFWVYGLDVRATDYIKDEQFDTKTALVIGNEGKGISRLVLENCDKLLKIDMAGKINSLNASVACAISVYEVKKSYGLN